MRLKMDRRDKDVDDNEVWSIVCPPKREGFPATGENKFTFI